MAHAEHHASWQRTALFIGLAVVCVVGGGLAALVRPVRSDERHAPGGHAEASTAAAERCNPDWMPGVAWERQEPYCDPSAARACCAVDADSYHCRVRDLLAARWDGRALGLLVGEPGSDRDGALRRLVPGLDAAELRDGTTPREGTVTFQCLDDKRKVRLSLPIAWDKPPCGDPYSLFRLQTLGWVGTMAGRRAENRTKAAAVLIDWAERAFDGKPLEHTWGDHAVSERLRAAIQFLRAYVQPGAVVERRAVHAAARIILTHVYELATQNCYAARHNHGFMQDLALLEAVLWLPNLQDAGALEEMAWARLQTEQVRASVTSDGIHIENSPHYHVLMVQLIAKTMEMSAAAGRATPNELAATQSALLGALVYQLQPNLTLPQFGDTTNTPEGERLGYLLSLTRQYASVDPTVAASLEYVLSHGAAGMAPARLDRVFSVGGYAALRSSWQGAEQAITGHFTCKRLSDVHYHQDETSFEIYGHGQELVVDSGRNGYRSDRFTDYQRAARAHNVLIVDGEPWGSKEDGQPSIVDHELGSDLSWVRGSHDYHHALGIEGQVRTFALARPDAFIVVDSLRANGRHDYQQHFHLHPSLSELSFPRPGVAVARMPGGPSLVLVAIPPPDRIDRRRGDSPSGQADSWWFPDDGQAVASTDLVLQSSLPAGEVRLPVLLLVVPPGGEVEIPEIEQRLAGEKLVLSWTQAGRRREAAVPARPLAARTGD